MKARTSPSEDMRAEYDFDYSNAVRGKYYRRLTSRSGGRAATAGR